MISNVCDLRRLVANFAGAKMIRSLGMAFQFGDALFQRLDAARQGFERLPNGNLIKEFENVGYGNHAVHLRGFAG